MLKDTSLFTGSRKKHLTSYLWILFDARGPEPAAGNSQLAEARHGLPDDNSELEPPDPIPNSVVKRFSADGSVGFPHVRVGHRQALFINPAFALGFFLLWIKAIRFGLKRAGESVAWFWDHH